MWLENLAAGNTYSYKIEVKEVLEYWETYKGAKYGATKFGDILKCDTYPNGSNPLSFKTPSDKNPEMSFIVINDIHQTPKTVGHFKKSIRKKKRVCRMSLPYVVG